MFGCVSISINDVGFLLFVVAFTVTLFFRSFAVFVPVLQMISSSVRSAFSLFSNFPSLIFHRKVDWSLFSVRFYVRRSRSVASLRFSFFVIGWKTPCLFSSVIRFCRSPFVILDCLSLLPSGLLSRFQLITDWIYRIRTSWKTRWPS